MSEFYIYTDTNSQRGHSLLELLIIILILGLFFWLSSVSFFHISPAYKLQKSVWEIYSILNYARYKSIFRYERVRISFNENSYSIERFEEKNGIWTIEKKKSFEGVLLQSNNNPVFYPRGTVSNMCSINISNSAGKFKISLAISGRIKVVKL